MKKCLFLLGLVVLFLLIAPGSYAAMITPDDVPIGIAGVNDGASYMVIIQVVLNYALIILGVLSVFFSIKNLVKVFKLKRTPKYDGKYARRFVYFLIAIVVIIYALLSFNTTWCCATGDDGSMQGGGFNIRLTF